MKLRIGFQGDLFSNNYFASIKFAEENKLDAELIPLINSYPVLEALVNDKIDYGVVAYKNSTAGTVEETETAAAAFAEHIKEIARITLPIHHCMFSLPSDDTESIRYICSHEQALRQCSKFIEGSYPDAVMFREKDTSLAALNLVSDKYSPGTSVICPKGCGIHYGLKLLHENIETDKNNHTVFKVFTHNY